MKEVEREVEQRLDKYLCKKDELLNPNKRLLPPTLTTDPDAKDQPIRNDTNILNIFQDKAYGKLLIIGKAGSGKTNALLELAQGLINQAREDELKLLPVLVDLSSWKNDKQSMREGLIAQLNKQYKFPKQTFREWFARRRILPLLDGLDEVKAEHQPHCISAINKLLEETNAPSDLVVCCRCEEYENLIEFNPDNPHKKLYYALELLPQFYAIELLPLTDQQIANYLDQVQRQDLRELIGRHLHLLELVRNPLMLHIAIKAYLEPCSEKLNQFNLSNKLQSYLFNRYIIKNIRNQLNSKNFNTIYWLHFLAQEMIKRNKKEFIIEELQPDWLPRHWQIIYQIVIGLLFTLLFSLFGVLIDQIIGGILFYLASALMFGVRFALYPEIEIIERFNLQNWSFTEAKTRLTISLIGAFFFGVISWFNNGFVAGLSVFFITALTVALVNEVAGLKENERSKKICANQGIWKSAINALMIGMLTGVIGTVISIAIVSNRKSNGLLDLLLIDEIKLSWLIAGLISLLMGGITCIQHFILRLMLCCNGFPWNFARFLDYATQLRFLQRIGGRYQFIHALLRDHFAIELPRNFPNKE